jgi:hypothetical protein
MLIDQNYPSPYNLKKLEYETFNYLRGHSTIESEPSFKTFRQDVYLFFSKISSTDSLYNDNLNFESLIEYDNLLFIVGFRISGIEKKSRKNQLVLKEYNFVSYSLTICKNNKGIVKPIRRFHFDYAIKRVGQPGPVFHFQFPGKLSPYVTEIGADCSDYDAKYESWLEKPRLNYFPISFAILLDILFTEFPSQATDKIKRDSRWLGILNKNEEKILKPYINTCQAYLNKSAASRLFTNNLCYGIDK